MHACVREWESERKGERISISHPRGEKSQIRCVNRNWPARSRSIDGTNTQTQRTCRISVIFFTDDREKSVPLPRLDLLSWEMRKGRSTSSHLFSSSQWLHMVWSLATPISLTPNAHIIFFAKNAKDLAPKMMMLLFKLHLKIWTMKAFLSCDDA